MKRKRTTRLLRAVREHYPLLLLLLLPVLGLVIGLLLSDVQWMGLTALSPIEAGFGGLCTAFWESCFQPMLLLCLLFLAGLSACGVPLIVLVPVFWGIGLGAVLGGYAAEGVGGLAVIAVAVLPHSAMEAVALIMATAESARMSLRFAVQVLPRSAQLGSLWPRFRLYGLRFLVLSGLLLAAGAVDVAMRRLCAAWL